MQKIWVRVLTTLMTLCVMGGIFSEGIDLQGEKLIGAVVVGTGLPMVCDERELFRKYFDEKSIVNHAINQSIFKPVTPIS